EELWTEIGCKIISLKKDNNLYFPDARIGLRKKITKTWEEIVNIAKNNDIKYYFGENAPYVYIAGGKALATLLSVKSNDSDYFTTKEIYPWEIKTDKIEISEKVINFGIKKQLIKRLYKTPHEIIHSFDIDCCSILINSEGEIYFTKRFLYALINGYNTFDFNYLSPSYE